MPDIYFEVNRYDSDGYLMENCIQLFMGDNIILKLGRNDLPGFIAQLQEISKEINDNYPKEGE